MTTPMKFPVKFTKHLRMAVQIGALASMVALTGCSSHMTKQECEAKDLYKMGLADGQDGKNDSNLQKYTSQCQAQGVTVPVDKYNYGHQVGLAQYCTDSRAKDDARRDKTDSICLQAKVPPYMTAYDSALNELKKQREHDLKDVQGSQAKLQKREEQLKGQLNKVDEQQKATPQ